MHIELITKSSSIDSISASEYRDLFDELRCIDPKTDKPLSLDKFIAHIGSRFSKALWGRYANGEIELNRAQKSELRIAVGLPELPPTVAEACSVADENAAVWKVGTEQPRTVVLVGSSTPLTLRVNGNVAIVDDGETSHVTPVTSARRHRTKMVRPVVTLAQNERREALHVRWADVIEMGLITLERKAKA